MCKEFKSFYDWCIEHDHQDHLDAWDYEKNSDTPHDISYGSERKRWFKCLEDKVHPHSYLMRLRNKTCLNNRCSFCSGKVLLAGVNDFETWCKDNVREDLLDSWDYEKNQKAPSEVLSGTNRKCWFKCPLCGCEHDHWLSHIKSGYASAMCPRCESVQGTSFPEQAIAFYAKKCFQNVVLHDRTVCSELDVYLSEIGVGIEYDGRDHLKSAVVKRDINKNNICKENGIRLIRIRESCLPVMKNCENIVRANRRDSSLQTAVETLFKMINVTVDVNITRDRGAILTCYLAQKVKNSIIETHPNIAKEWNYENNNGLKPEMFTRGSQHKAWWTCPDCGHVYQTQIKVRTHGTGCPECANRMRSQRIKEGMAKAKAARIADGSIKNIVITHSHLIDEWNYELNGDFRPEMFTRGSHERVWWTCSDCWHVYQAQITNRTQGTGCPECANRMRSQRTKEAKAKAKAKRLALAALQIKEEGA